MEISRETFENKETSDRVRQLMMFDMISSVDAKLDTIADQCPLQAEKCEKRFKKLSRGNKIWSGGGGIIGGMLAVIASKLFGMN